MKKFARLLCLVWVTQPFAGLAANPRVLLLAHCSTPSNAQATVVDVAVLPAHSAISNVTVAWSSNNWLSSSPSSASLLTGIVYRATLPGAPAGTTFRYTAVAKDLQGNLAWGPTNAFTVYDGTVPCYTCRIMAANTTSGNYQAYEDPGIRIFQGLKPDIVAIQEFNYRNGALRQLVDLAFGTNFYFYVEPGGESIPNGIVSRWPIIATGEWDDPYVPDRDFAWATIDIPGPRNLHVISVHLWSSGGSSGRNNEAILLTNYIRRSFPSSDFIVLAGDLNTDSRTEPALTTLKTLFRDTRIPVDKNNNDKTNEPRTKPYDYVLPNPALDSNHVAVVIDNRAYPFGLVFDSAVWHDATLPPPILPGDSHVFGMQHMPVLKDFLLYGDPPNRPPAIAPLAHYLLMPGEAFTLQIVATDPDNDSITLTCSDDAHFSAPVAPGATTGMYAWTPSTLDLGEHALLFTALAANQTASRVVSLSVVPEPTPLLLTIIPTFLRFASCHRT